MASSVRVLFLVAISLAVAVVAVAAADNKWESSSSCDVVCAETKYQLLAARKKCCQKASEAGQCLCPTMNTVIDAGVPLMDVCYDDMKCGDSQGTVVDVKKPCSVPENGACDEFLGVLRAKNNYACYIASDILGGGRCIVKILTEAGIRDVANKVKYILGI